MSGERGHRVLERKLETGDLLSFDFVNWHGRNHRYLIAPEKIELAFTPENEDEPTWVLHGEVITRDGDPRPEMGNRRRTFRMNGLRNIRVEKREA